MTVRIKITVETSRGIHAVRNRSMWEFLFPDLKIKAAAGFSLADADGEMFRARRAFGLVARN